MVLLLLCSAAKPLTHLKRPRLPGEHVLWVHVHILAHCWVGNINP